MRKILGLILSIIMILACSYTAMANVNVNTTVKLIDVNGETRDITAKLSNRYVTDNYVLMVPTQEVLKEMGFTVFEWDNDKKILCAGRISDQRKIALYCSGEFAGIYALECQATGGQQKISNTIEKPTIVNGKSMIAIKDLVSLTSQAVRVDPLTSTFYIALNDSEFVRSLPTSDAWENYFKNGTALVKEPTTEPLKEPVKEVPKKEKVLLYSADGRIRYTNPNEVEAYKKVGWYEKCPIVGKTYWFCSVILPYDGFEPKSQYMQQRPRWLSRAITGYNSATLEKINENQSKITEFYYWENSKLVKVKTETLLTGNHGFYDEWIGVCDQNPKVKYDISDWEWNKIQKQEYTFIGMTYDGFRLAGHSRPDRINTTTTAYGIHEQVVYNWTSSSDYYYFDNGYLTAWQD